MNTPLLYFSPGSVSMPVHMVLRELGLNPELKRTPTGDDAHLTAAYLAVNPAGRVPALALDGRVFTEVWSILRYLAARHPEAGLVPAHAQDRARLDEILSRALTAAQPSYRMVMRPDRVLGPDSDPAAQEAVRAAGRRDFAAALDQIERIVADEGWALGDGVTVADPVIATLSAWARYAQLDIERWPKLRRIGRAYFARPAAQATLVAEGLVDEQGRPTPPTRV